MSRAIELTLEPSSTYNRGAEVQTFTYDPATVSHRSMAEEVTLHISAGGFRSALELTPDEARVLANQLLQVADTADEHRAAREAEDELQRSYDEICEDLRNADEDGRGMAAMYGHPWVHYVPAGQLLSKTKELQAAGVKQFMVLVDPYAEAA